MLNKVERTHKSPINDGKAISWLIRALVSSLIILGMAIGFAKILAHNEADEAAWTQAVGAVFAIVSGFGATLYQLDRQKSENQQAEIAAGQAAFRLAFEAFEAVTDRLEAALTPPEQAKNLALRGARSRELVGAMREFNTGRLPNAILPDFIRLRSLVAAINARLTEVYDSEESVEHGGRGRNKLERYNRLESAVKTRAEAENVYKALRAVAVENFAADDLKLTETKYLLAYKKTAN
jgi:hypothetical protein